MSDSQDPTDAAPRWHTTAEIAFGTAVLIFGLGIIWSLLYFPKDGAELSAMTLKHVGLTLIVTTTLFLIVAGFSEKQSATAMGLLGTAAGYILADKVSDRVSKKGEDGPAPLISRSRVDERSITTAGRTFVAALSYSRRFMKPRRASAALIL